MRKVVLFGDSLTQEAHGRGGWGQLLADRYMRRADVVNRGFSGYNSRWAMEALDSLNADLSSAVLGTIFFGANDASTGVQHVPPAEFRANLERAAAHFFAQGCSHVVIICPPPVDAALYFQKFLEPRNKTDVDRSNSNLAPYVLACAAAAEASGAHCLDLFAALSQPGLDTASHLRDGLHLSEKGNGVLGTALFDLIAAEIPELVVTPCAFTGNFGNSGSKCVGLVQHAPWWDHVNHAGPAPYLPAALVAGDADAAAAPQAAPGAAPGAASKP